MAIDSALSAYNEEKNPVAKIEYLLFLGGLYGRKGNFYDSVQADQYFSDALYWALDILPTTPEDPASKMRVGLAYLGLKKYDLARQYLEIAAFTELRPYYLGRILLNLGKASAQGLTYFR